VAKSELGGSQSLLSVGKLSSGRTISGRRPKEGHKTINCVRHTKEGTLSSKIFEKNTYMRNVSRKGSNSANHALGEENGKNGISWGKWGKRCGKNRLAENLVSGEKLVESITKETKERLRCRGGKEENKAKRGIFAERDLWKKYGAAGGLRRARERS